MSINWSKDLVLTHNDALYAANIFEDYFGNFEHITDYYKEVKKETLDNLPTPMFGMSVLSLGFTDHALPACNF